MKHVQATVPAGTVLEIDRVYVRTMNKAAAAPEDDYDSVTFKFAGAKKKVRFWAKLVDVNFIEYELPDDFTAGKKLARENAKKPKKLTPVAISDLLSSAMRGTSYRTNMGDYKKWYTSKVSQLFGDIAREYEKRKRPLDLQHLKIEKETRDAERRRQFNTGALSIPMGLASVIKTFEDYDARFPDTYGQSLNTYYYSKEYVISHLIVGNRYESTSGKRSFVRDASNRCVRSWRGAKLEELPSYKNEEVDVSDMWIEVVSDEDDIQIVEVHGGFTPVQTTA
jgi:hypothetical protein